MRHLIRVGRLAVLTVLAFAALATPAAPGAAAQPACHWAGTWSTDWEDITLEQIGSRVIGVYDYHKGALVGTISGSTLAGTWGESPDYTAPETAGDFEFTMSADCKSVAGRWRSGSRGSWSDWSATRAETYSPSDPMASCSWAGTWTTSYGTAVITQSGGQVTGSYEYQGGKLTGSAQGLIFTGTWSESNGDTGDDELVMSPSCRVFVGRWRDNRNGPWSIWTGVRA